MGGSCAKGCLSPHTQGQQEVRPPHWGAESPQPGQDHGESEPLEQAKLLSTLPKDQCLLYLRSHQHDSYLGRWTGLGTRDKPARPEEEREQGPERLGHANPPGCPLPAQPAPRSATAASLTTGLCHPALLSKVSDSNGTTDVLDSKPFAIQIHLFLMTTP